MMAAAVQRKQADYAEFERVAIKMIDRFSRSNSPYDIERTLKVCSMLEGSLDISAIDVNRIQVALRRKQIDPLTVPFFELAFGLMALRDGNHPQAAERCRSALESTVQAPDYKYAVDPAALAVMSIAFSRTAQHEEARASYNDARSKLDRLISQGVYVGEESGVQPHKNLNHDILIAQLLVEQAERVLQDAENENRVPRT
jgi:hypothetical protein